MFRALVFKIFCWSLFIALCWQVHFVIDQYLLYETITQLEIVRPVNVSAPVFSACFSLREIPKARQLLTAAEIFSVLPPSDAIGYLRLIHDQNAPTVKVLSTQRTSDFLNLKLTIKNSFAWCSNQVKSHYNNFNYDYIVRSTWLPRFYQFSMLQEIFPSTEWLVLYLSSEKDFLSGATEANLEIDRLINFTTGEGMSNNIATTHQMYKSRRLPPYPTRCLDYETIQGKSQKHCLSECLMNKSTDSLNAIPFSVEMTSDRFRNSPIVVANKQMYANKTYVNAQQAIDALCAQICHRPNCEEEIFVIKMSSSGKNFNLKFDVNASDAPIIVCNFIPVFSFLEFAILVLSCFGFWIGISPLSILLDNKLTQKLMNATPLLPSSHALCDLKFIDQQQLLTRLENVMKLSSSRFRAHETALMSNESLIRAHEVRIKTLHAKRSAI